MGRGGKRALSGRGVKKRADKKFTYEFWFGGEGSLFWKMVTYVKF